ncbi:MAG TPA: tetratricopeptide repeat protein [Opitutaceae bacterium]|jgi:tetratricopeptide (TPR) repeat protein|nr:tetratricopeptide repeat protein [Opitutaceae bacterium]
MTFRIPHVPILLLILGAAPDQSRASDSGLKAELAAADALRDAQRSVDARAAYAKILQEAPDNPEANCSYGLYACDAGDWQTALRCEAKALAADPHNARYQYGWGAANGTAALKASLFSKLGYAKKCLAAYQRASELEPRNLQYHWGLLQYYQQAPGIVGGDMAQAYVQAAELKKLDPSSGHQAFAQLYLREKKYGLAFQEYDEALRAAPDSYSDLYNFGRLALMTGQRLEEALGAFRRCLALTPGRGLPTHGNVHWRIGGVFEQQGHPDQARAEYLEALKEQPGFRPAQQALDKLNQVKA